MRHVWVHGACALTLALCAGATPALAHRALADPVAPPALVAAASDDRAEAAEGEAFSGDTAGLFDALDAGPNDHVVGLAMIMADVFAIASGRDGLGPAEKYTAAGALARVEAQAAAVLETDVAEVVWDGGLAAGPAFVDPGALVDGASLPLAGSKEASGVEMSDEPRDTAALAIDNYHTPDEVILPTVLSVAVDNRPSAAPLRAVQIETAFTPASGRPALALPDRHDDEPFNVAADGGNPAGAINAN